MQSNMILSSLSTECREDILVCCVEVDLPVLTYLYEAGEVPEHAYFMTSGMASIVANMPNGATTEVEIVCCEGLVGSLHLLGDTPITTDCFMQIAGTALRIELSKLQTFFKNSPEMRARVLEYIQRQVLVVSQMVACNRLHGAEQRLALWLLMASDRTSSSTIHVTQEFLAEMIGTQRSTVTAMASSLQHKGAIKYNRGKITIEDHSTLEKSACHCYSVIQNIAASEVQDAERRAKLLV
jgi:CRP-like cAMP-binding protein